MKKAIKIGFTIAFILAMIKTASLMQSLGFALTLLIGFYLICCFVGVTYLVFEGINAINSKEAMRATKIFLLAIIIFVVAIKIFIWLIKTLN